METILSCCHGRKKVVIGREKVVIDGKKVFMDRKKVVMNGRKVVTGRKKVVIMTRYYDIAYLSYLRYVSESL